MTPERWQMKEFDPHRSALKWRKMTGGPCCSRFQQSGACLNLPAAYDWFCEHSQNLERSFNSPG